VKVDCPGENTNTLPIERRPVLEPDRRSCGRRTGGGLAEAEEGIQVLDGQLLAERKIRDMDKAVGVSEVDTKRGPIK